MLLDGALNEPAEGTFKNSNWCPVSIDSIVKNVLSLSHYTAEHLHSYTAGRAEEKGNSAPHGDNIIACCFMHALICKEVYLKGSLEVNQKQVQMLTTKIILRVCAL